MLKNLSIRNFALIDNVDLDFDKGLTVITGETGSGKSILLGALHLLLGNRADFSVIRNQEAKTVVEGHWMIGDYNLSGFFASKELEYDPYCIIRREILPQGKSRAFVNDTPVPLSVLKELTDKLVQINSQHQTLQLKDKSFQLNLLDVLGSCIPELEAYKEAFDAYKAQEKLIRELETGLSESLQQQDYIRFQVEELEKLNFKENNYDELILELKKSENAEFLLKNIQESVEITDSGDGIVALLKRLENLLRKSAQFDESLQEYENRINSVVIEMNDISAELNNYAEGIAINPGRLDWLVGVVDDFQRILKKHNKKDQVELKSYLDELSGQNESFSALEEKLEKEHKKLEKFFGNWQQAGKILSEKRRKVAPVIVKEILPLLEELKLEGSRAEFRFTEKTNADRSGFESVDLCFSPNQGVAIQPIDKSASGGELSRFMLAVMTLFSERKQLPTLIFDEIDTGVSGDVAGRIGLLLRKMGMHRQLMAITHLPQVAASGHIHLSVNKSTQSNRTVTEVIRLTEEDRIVEIAKLMSGKNLTDAAQENAAVLLKTHGN